MFAREKCDIFLFADCHMEVQGDVKRGRGVPLHSSHIIAYLTVVVWPMVYSVLPVSSTMEPTGGNSTHPTGWDDIEQTSPKRYAVKCKEARQASCTLWSSSSLFG